MDEQNAGATPDTDETAVIPAADEGTTRIVDDAGAQPTRAMPASGGTPPPPRPQPTLLITRPPEHEGSGGGWWIVLVVVVLAAAAAAGLWFFVFRDKGETAPSPSPTPSGVRVDWAGAWGRTDGVAGGLVIEQSGGAYRVTVYDSSLLPTGSAAASETGDGRVLLFTLPPETSFSGMPGPLVCRLTVGPSADAALLDATAANQTSVSMPLRRVLALVPASPSPSPSASVLPSGSPSPAASGTPLSSVDQQVIYGLVKIQTGVVTWATNNGDLYPLPTEVTQAGGVAQYVAPWPINPVTNQPMAPGSDTGDYTYEQVNGGQSYRLVGHLTNGVTYALP